MAWEIRRIVNEEGLTVLGPYKTRQMAMLRAEENAKFMKAIGYDLVWYEFVEVADGV